MDLKMLTTDEVASCLGTTRQTVEMLRQVGILDAIKIGKRYMFPSTTIIEFQSLYLGQDLSNKAKAIIAKEIVDSNNNH